MDCLARREHSLQELVDKLQRKFPDCVTEKIVQVVERLRAQNLQSDERFAASYVRYRKGRGFGYRHIRANLLARQVADGVIEAVLQRDDKEWSDIATRLVEQRLSGNSLSPGSKEHARLQRFLQSRGFSQADISAVLQPYFKRASEAG